MKISDYEFDARDVVSYAYYLPPTHFRRADHFHAVFFLPAFPRVMYTQYALFRISNGQRFFTFTNFGGVLRRFALRSFITACLRLLCTYLFERFFT